MHTQPIYDALTAKQQQTLGLLVRGHTSKSIAKQFGVSPAAIDQRIEALLRRLNLSTRRELMEWYQTKSEQTGSDFPQLEETTDLPKSSELDGPGRARFIPEASYLRYCGDVRARRVALEIDPIWVLALAAVAMAIRDYFY